MVDILYKDESYKIIGACMEVHKNLGPGFLESVYSEALEIEFKNCRIPYSKEMKLSVFYEGKRMKKYFRADFICYDSIIIEIKSKPFIIDADVRQTMNNVKATNFKLGILINFGAASLFYKRVVN